MKAAAWPPFVPTLRRVTAGLVVAVFAAYAHTLSAPFVYDDGPAILVEWLGRRCSHVPRAVVDRMGGCSGPVTAR